MTFSKGGVFFIALIIGLLVGSSPNISPEINNLKSIIPSAFASLAKTLGQGSQDVGEFVAE